MIDDPDGLWDSGLWESSLLELAILPNAELAKGLNYVTFHSIRRLILSSYLQVFGSLGPTNLSSWVPPKCYCIEMHDQVTHVLGKSDGHD
jgi:hypothetical protein